MPMYVAWTDGAYRSTTNTGGYASVITKDGEIITILYQGYKNTTNNRCELMGVLETLKYFKEPTKIHIVSDSQYVVSSIINKHVHKWFKDNDLTKKNLDLWFQILDLLSFHDVTFEWVKGHADNDWNNKADLYAQHAATCMNLPTDIMTYEQNNSENKETG